MTEVTDKVDRAIARFERVTRQMDERKGPVRAAAVRERQRALGSYGGALLSATGIAGAIVIAAMIVGLFTPIGMMGFVGAVAVAIAAFMLIFFGRVAGKVSAPAPSPDLPNGEMVQRFDSYLYRTRRALPVPAQNEIDRMLSALPPLTQTLDRVATLDPKAQDARRLMSLHLPGLVDRYLNVPSAFRRERDGEGKTVDERLVEGLAAGREALSGIAEQLARDDVAALETQGRFIQSRYGEQPIDG